ncbi:MAG: polyprenol monophosphomannose synthase [Nigerium sp.]|nr:polyprenol monophosphomannose synthase [Nigerium sp.]
MAQSHGAQAHDGLGRILVIIPTYNEIDNIDMITGRLRVAVPDADILIVDDNSPDATGRRADELHAADESIHVLHRQGKEGLGAAYLAGFGWGLERNYDVLVEFDADGSHQPEQLPAVLAGLHDADMVKGSRWVKGGAVVNWPLHRELLSRGGSLYIRLMLGVPVRDVTGGLNAFRADVLRDILDAPIDKQGYGIQRDLTLNAHRRGYRIAEVPIEFIERTKGESKMSGSVVKEAMIRTTELGLKYRGEQLAAGFARARAGAESAGERAGRFVGAVSKAAHDTVRATRNNKGGAGES